MIQKTKFETGLRKFIPNIKFKDVSKGSTSYFKIMNLNERVGLGKNSFRINTDENNLVPGSTVWIDIIDSNGNTIYHEISPIKANDNSRLVIFHIYQDTPPGTATIYIAGRMKYNISNGNAVAYSSDPSDPNYYEIPNIYWAGEISVVPNENNANEIVYINEPKVSIKEVNESYRKINSSTDRKVLFENNTSLDTSRGSNSIASNFNVIPIKETSESNDLDSLIKDPQTTLTTSTTLGTTEYIKTTAVVKITNRKTFIKNDMLGGIFKISDILQYSQLPQDIDPGFVLPDVEYSGSIIKIIDTENIVLDKSFEYDLIYTNNQGSQSKFVVNKFSTNTYSIEYYSSDITLDEKSLESYINISIKDLQPVAGNVNQIEISYKPYGTFGELINLGKFKLNKRNYLVDNTIIVPGKIDIEYLSMWNLPTNGAYNDYWTFTLPAELEKDLTTKFPAGLEISRTDDMVHDFTFELTNTISLPGNVEYSLSGKTFNELSKTAQLDFYISSTEIETDPMIYYRDILPSPEISGYTHIGSINYTTGSLKEFNIFFYLLADSDVKILVKGWSISKISISDLQLNMRNSIGYGPNYHSFKIPLSSFKKDNELIINLNYYNDNLKAKVESVLYGLKFVGKINIEDVKAEIGAKYTWTAYANTPDGKSNFSLTYSDQHYIGTAENKDSPTPSIDADDYVWSLHSTPYSFVVPGISTDQTNDSDWEWTFIDWGTAITGPEFWNDTYNGFKNPHDFTMNVKIDIQLLIDKDSANHGVFKIAILDSVGDEQSARYFKTMPWPGYHMVKLTDFVSVPQNYIVSIQFRSGILGDYVTIKAHGPSMDHGVLNYFSAIQY